MTTKTTIERRKKAEQRLKEICKERGFKHRSVISKNRKREIVLQRKECVKILRGEGFSLLVIAYVLNRDHTSIMYLLDEDMRNVKRERAIQLHSTEKKYKKIRW